MKTRTGISYLLGAIGSVFSAIAGTSADAAPLAKHPSMDHSELLTKWNSLRDKLDQKSDRVLNEDVMEFLRTVDLRNGLEQAIELSYGLVSAEEIDLLDEVWLETLISRGDSTLVSHYLVIRARITGIQSNSGQTYMDHWLWEAMGAGGCDGGGGGGNNGHGNGDQDAPGNSDDNNNAENSDNSGEGNSGNGGGGNTDGNTGNGGSNNGNGGSNNGNGG